MDYHFWKLSVGSGLLVFSPPVLCVTKTVSWLGYFLFLLFNEPNFSLIASLFIGSLVATLILYLKNLNKSDEENNDAVLY